MLQLWPWPAPASPLSAGLRCLSPDTLPNILRSPGPTGGQPDGEFPTADT